jgi:mannose-6-phosphate isomerase-like protein (cupin superfamily)
VSGAARADRFRVGATVTGMDDTDQTPPAATDPTATETAFGRVRPVDLRDYVDCVRGEATRVRVFQTAALAVDVWCVEPRSGTEVLHHPDRDVAYTVIAGRSWFVTDDGEVGLDPMGALLVPADVVHGFENRGPDPLIVLASCSPPGEDGEDAPVVVATDAVHLPREGGGRVRRVVESLLGGSRASG